MHNSPTQRRRAKLVEKLEEQLQGAEALISGMSFQTTKRITRTDANGELERVTVPKRFRAWFWHDISGVWFLEVRYGARALKLEQVRCYQHRCWRTGQAGGYHWHSD